MQLEVIRRRMLFVLYNLVTTHDVSCYHWGYRGMHVIVVICVSTTWPVHLPSFPTSLHTGQNPARRKKHTLTWAHRQTESQSVYTNTIHHSHKWPQTWKFTRAVYILIPTLNLQGSMYVNSLVPCILEALLYTTIETWGDVDPFTDRLATESPTNSLYWRNVINITACLRQNSKTGKSGRAVLSTYLHTAKQTARWCAGGSNNMHTNSLVSKLHHCDSHVIRRQRIV